MTKNLTKIAILSLLLTKGAFAEFLPFVEFTTGMYNHSGNIFMQETYNKKIIGKEKVDFDEKATLFGSIGFGAIYQFDNHVFLGARISTQNIDKNVEIGKIEFLNIKNPPIFVNTLLGFNIHQFKPYILAGYSHIKAELEVNDFLLEKIADGNFLNEKEKVFGGFYTGVGLEYEISQNLTILTEYIQGSNSNESVDNLYIHGKNFYIKTKTKYSYKMLKVGARYYFGR